MPISINGSGSITGITAGGLPDGCILDADINGVAASKLTGTLPDARFPATLPAVSGANLTNIASDFVKLQRASAAGGTGDLIFDNLDVATYKVFDLTLFFTPSTNNVSCRMQFRTGGASGSNISASHHQTAYQYLYSSNGQSQSTSAGASDIYLSGATGSSSVAGISLYLRISLADSTDNGYSRNRANSVWWQAMMHDNSNNPNWIVGSATLTDGGGGAGGTTNYPTGFKFDTSSGNIGNYSYLLYGLKR